MILSRFPILESDFFGFGNGILPDIFSFKGILYAKISIHSKILHVFTLHVQASYPNSQQEIQTLYEKVRQEQLLSAVKFIKEKIKHTDEPFVFVGDFNIDGNSEEYDRMMTTLQDLNIKDILRCAYGKPPSTYGILLPSGEPEETVLSHKNENDRNTAIDYIFISKSGGIDNIAEETKVEPFYVESEPFTRISDHYGVQSTIII